MDQDRTLSERFEEDHGLEWTSAKVYVEERVDMSPSDMSTYNEQG